MHLVEVLVRQVSDKALALETTAGAGYSAQRSQSGSMQEGYSGCVFGELGKPVSFIDFKDQELGSLEGNVRKATERKV